MRIRKRITSAQLREKGRCIHCTRLLDRTGSICSFCCNAMVKRRITLQLEGKCTRCGKENVNKRTKCDTCLLSQRVNYKPYAKQEMTVSDKQWFSLTGENR